jgi:hypothetical protein
MKKQKNILISLFLCLSLLVYSCKNENKIVANSEKNIFQNQIEFKVDFPDTLYVDQFYDGIINYKSMLDTIITTFGNKNENRYTRFILTTSDNINYDFEYLKKIVKDSFGAVSNREIPFYDIKFSEPGVYYIDGIINDNILIDTMTRYNKRNDKLRYIENEERVTHKVVVIERPVR